MQTSIRWSIACSLMAGILAATGCGDSAEGEHAWLGMNFTTYSHRIFVEVNGEPFAEFQREGSGFESKLSPMREGQNSIHVRFEPRGKSESISTTSELRFLFTPDMMPGATPVPGLELSNIDLYAEADVDIDWVDGKPAKFAWTTREWMTAEKKNLVWRLQITKDPFSGDYLSQSVETWTPEGQPIRNETYKNDLYVDATFYKPDGTVGAEIKDGNGFLREWNEQGHLAIEVEVKDGNYVNPVRVFDPTTGEQSGTMTIDEWLNL